MAKQGLDKSYVGPVLKHERSGCVAEQMARTRLGYTRGLNIAPDTL